MFCVVFKEKKDLLELYNAINGTDYQNEEELIVNTLDGSLYMYMKNDISFIIDAQMNLYEHQSTFNPNMPLRGLFYFSRLYEIYIKLHKIDVYSKTLQKLPTPKYVVFYNGTKEEPDKRILRLSEAFENGEGCLECEAIMLNINYGHNRNIMERCRKLQEDVVFVDAVRRYVKESNGNLTEAIMYAINECIEKDILREILEKQKAEVLTLILSTFDRELYESNLKKDAFAEGEEKGRNDLLKKMVSKKVEKGLSIEKMALELEITQEEIEKILAEIKN